MSNHSVIEHRANYHFVKMEEDYLAICSRGVQSPHCKALILSILEHWTNTKRDRGESEYVYMSIPQWIQYTYMLYERNVITDCIAELMNEGFISRRPLIMYGQKTFEYCLNVEPIQMCIRMLAQKGIEEVLPNLDGYLAYKIATKERREAAKAQVGEKSRTYNKVREKSHGVGEKSRKVRDNSRRGYVKNQRNLDSNTKINIDSTKKDSLVANATQTHTGSIPAEYASLPIPVTYAEALTYLQPHGPHDGLDAVQVMKLAQKLWVEAHPQGETDDGQLADTQQTLPVSLSMADEVSSISTLPTAETIPASGLRQQTRSQSRLHDAEKPIAHPTSKASQASDTPQFALSPAAIRKQHKQRQDAIIALLCEVTGEKVVKSSKNTRGAELLAESDATDEEIKIVIRALRADPFWCKQMTLLTVAEQFNSRLSMAKMAIPDAAQPAWNGGVYNIFYDTTLTPEEIERQVTSEFYNQEKWEASLRKAAN